MNDIQLEKVDKKLNILKELILNLSSYNGIEGYDNNKKFVIEIDNIKGDKDNNYVHSISIRRGCNYPKEILNMRFVHNQDSLDTVYELLKFFINSKDFHYISYTKSNKLDYESLSINLKNNVSIKVGLHSIFDIKKAKELEKISNSNVIIFDNKSVAVDKNIIQKDKALKIIDAYLKILLSIKNYNNIDNYNNIKPFSFEITNYYDKNRECFVYSFDIIRGSMNRENILNFRASIRDKSVILNKLKYMIDVLKGENDYTFDVITNIRNESFYQILFNKCIKISFGINDMEDEKFYNNIKEDIDDKDIKRLKK